MSSIDDLLDLSPEEASPLGLPDGVDTQTLATLLGLGTKRVSELTRDGVIPKAGRNLYRPTQAIPAYVKYVRKTGRPRTATSPDKERLTAAQADLAEVKLAQTRGELLSAQDVQTRWIAYTSALRAALLAVPPRLSAKLGLGRDAAAELDAEMRAALADVSADGRECKK